MAWQTPTTWPLTKTPAITIRHLQKISDNLSFLKTTYDNFNTTLTNFNPAPTARVCTFGSGVWSTGRAYTSGKIVVFFNGRLLRRSLWADYSPPSGQFTTSFASSTSDKVVVLDWTL